MKVLVTGGAGYIGSHTVRALIDAGHEVVVFDNLAQGHKQSIQDINFVDGDLLNLEDIKKALEGKNFDGVIHFAALALAGESMKDPYAYFRNNVQGGLNLLEAMHAASVKNIIFSSTCAVYGFPDKLPVTEDEKKAPVSVYGESKLMFESVLDWYERVYEIKNVRLRYFNASGDSEDGSIGEEHDPETHIIPIAIEAAMGKRDRFVIFGDDYKTDDGTCVRDYIHVLDLASAHIKALEYLINGGKSDVFNLGVGKGYSNREILDMVKKVSDKDFKVEIGPRRDGDPDAIYADNSKAKEILGWEPVHSDLETIIKSAWNWHSKHPDGY